MIFPLLPVFLTEVLKAGPAYIGLVEGAADTVSSLLKLASGVVADRVPEAQAARALRLRPRERGAPLHRPRHAAVARARRPRHRPRRQGHPRLAARRAHRRCRRRPCGSRLRLPAARWTTRARSSGRSSRRRSSRCTSRCGASSGSPSSPGRSRRPSSSSCASRRAPSPRRETANAAAAARAHAAGSRRTSSSWRSSRSRNSSDAFLLLRARAARPRAPPRSPSSGRCSTPRRSSGHGSAATWPTGCRARASSPAGGSSTRSSTSGLGAGDADVARLGALRRLRRLLRADRAGREGAREGPRPRRAARARVRRVQLRRRRHRAARRAAHGRALARLGPARCARGGRPALAAAAGVLLLVWDAWRGRARAALAKRRSEVVCLLRCPPSDGRRPHRRRPDPPASLARRAQQNTVDDLGPYLDAPVRSSSPHPSPRATSCAGARAPRPVGGRVARDAAPGTASTSRSARTTARATPASTRATRRCRRAGWHPRSGPRKKALVYVHGWLEPGPWIEEAVLLPRLYDELGVDVLHVQLPFHGTPQPEERALPRRVLLERGPGALVRGRAAVVHRRAHARRVAPRPGLHGGRRHRHQPRRVDHDGPGLRRSDAGLHRADRQPPAARRGGRGRAHPVAHEGGPRAVRRRPRAAQGDLPAAGARLR